MKAAYIRVSTGKQDTDNQRFEIERYCRERGIGGVTYVEETVSGTKDVSTRQLGTLINELGQGDMLIVTEISRLSRSLFTVFSTLQDCLRRGITIVTVREGYEFKDDISSQVMAFAFGLAADIERRLISARTKEALARKRAEGAVLGRPVGSTKPENLKLYGQDERILRLMDKRVSVSAIARLLGVHRGTLTAYIERQSLRRELRYREVDRRIERDAA